MKTTATIPRPITDYQGLSYEELFRRTSEAKRVLGDRVMILGHNYQRDEVIEHADFRGDSLLLSKLAAERSERPYIVFCGVHFMAETADILSRSQQTVILPDMAAGCSMADMAAIEQVDQCWETLGRILPVEETVKPAVYVNSAAVLKAFCGGHGGITCTSSNDRAAIEWCWARREKILFFPDEHLGRNPANKMGLSREQMIVCDPFQPNGGNNRRAVHFAQQALQVLDPDRTVWEQLQNDFPNDSVGAIRSLAGAFQFSGDDVEKKIRALSGGEKTRLAMARMLLDPPNFLVLDEPTNHLDLATKDMLVEALGAFEGTMFFVSHDRAFLRGLSNRVLELGGESGHDAHPHLYPGSYVEYVARTGHEAPGVHS